MAPRFSPLSAALVAGSLATLAACGSESGEGATNEDQFVIGVVEDRSGSASLYSTQAREALNIYVDALNSGNTLFADDVLEGEGILGREIKLIFEDDQNNPNQTALKARSLLDQGAHALMFTTGSSSTIQGRTVCTQESVFCMAPTNVNSTIVEPPNNEFIFTAAPPSGLTAETYVDAWKSLGYQKVAFFSDNTATGQGLAEAYQGVAEDAGFEIVASEVVEPGARDASAQITRMLNSNPDVIMDTTQAAPESALLYEGLERAGTDIPRWASNSVTAQPKTWDIVGDAIDGVIVVDPVSPENPRTDEVRQLLNDAGDTEPMTFIETTVWDGLVLLKKAFDEAGSTDGAAAVEALEGVSDFPAATGQESFAYSFSADKHNGSAPDQNVVVQFEDAAPSKLLSDFQPTK